MVGVKEGSDLRKLKVERETLRGGGVGTGAGGAGTQTEKRRREVVVTQF